MYTCLYPASKLKVKQRQSYGSLCAVADLVLVSVDRSCIATSNDQRRYWTGLLLLVQVLLTLIPSFIVSNDSAIAIILLQAHFLLRMTHARNLYNNTQKVAGGLSY